MTIDCSGNPKRMVEDISALGLRHAGYAIPTEFMFPLVSDAVEVVRTMMTDKNAKDSVSEQMQLALLTLALVQIFSTQDHAAAAIAKAGTSTASAWKCDTSSI